MRTTVNHTPPAEMQPMPADNTSEYAMAQVALWAGGSGGRRTGVLIHTQTAMEIAAWWQSPGPDGIAFAVFASTGTVTDDLLPDGSPEADALRALDAYVRACSVPMWSVGSNIAGYLPMTDPAVFLDYADAVEHFRDVVEQAPDEMLPDEDEIGADGQSEYDALTAHVGAFLTDDAPHTLNGRAFGPERESSISLQLDSAPLPTVYFLSGPHWTLMSEYLDSREA